MSDKVAELFVLRAIQDWGQSEADRIAAVQAVLDAAGFKAAATSGPVFGRIWPSPCTGEDGEAASAWLQHLTTSMRRSKFEHEAEHVKNAIAERASA
jgi:hypothetical protein